VTYEKKIATDFQEFILIIKTVRLANDLVFRCQLGVLAIPKDRLEN
jgi:hypothetical protein